MIKQVLQLNEEGYLVGVTEADESPLEPGVWLIPYGAVDTDLPSIPDGFIAKWNGSSFDMEAYVAPTDEPASPPVTNNTVSSVTARQARLALLESPATDLQYASLLDQLEAFINLSDNRRYKIEWEYASTIERDSPIVDAISMIFQWTPSEIDALFEAANNF